MKLYYVPGACSLSPHIVLREAGLPFELVRVSMRNHTLADGTDFYALNAKGYVPLLELDGGERLTEGPAIVQYLADRVPDKQLAPPAGTMAHYRLQEWLNFITSEVHKGFGVLFTPGMPDEAKTLSARRVAGRLAWVDGELAGKNYLLGEAYSVADPYLFTVAGWAKHVGIDTSGMPNLTAFMARMGERPAVQQALQAEAPAA